MGILGYFRQKGGSHPIHRDVIKKKTENISEFFAKRGGGGGLANSKISLSEKNGASELLRGGGGVSEFRGFSEKKQYFFLMPPLRDTIFKKISLIFFYLESFKLEAFRWLPPTHYVMREKANGEHERYNFSCLQDSFIGDLVTDSLTTRHFHRAL